MASIEMSFALSAPARRALASLSSARNLEYIAARFFDTIANERYRAFAIEPQYYTSPHGRRMARSFNQRPPGEKVESRRTALTIRMLREMKKLQARGLSLTWQMEEILYFGFREGLL